MRRGRRWMALAAGLLPLAAALPVRAGSNATTAPRVVRARAARGDAVRALFTEKGLPYPAPRLLVRVFKREGEVELWGGREGGEMVKVKTWPVCANSGELGPKRQRGDLQVPEGFYVVDRYNAWSNFHLSLGVNYPNRSDRLRLAGRRDLGGDIFIHGNCVTIGCVPIEDGPIEELFLAALDAHEAGLKWLPVHLFPARMDDDGMAWLAEQAGEDAELLAFWKMLEPGYRLFEETKRPPRVSVDSETGRYRIRARRD